MHCKRLWPLAAACALITTGCSPATGLYPVRGQVLYQGKPAVGASVSFVRKGATDPSEAQISQGIVQEDGAFTLASAAGTGAAPGEYLVLIEWKQGAGKVRGRSPALNAPDRLKGRYLDARRPMLTATVTAANNDLPPFELK
jgi:hypothetical protein